MKLELSEADIKQALIQFAKQRLGGKFNEVTFYFRGATGDGNPIIDSALIEYTKHAEQQP